MKTFKSLLTRFGILGLLASATVFLAACGGGGNGTSTGPASGASFSGAVIAFNPTITFTSGTTFSWSNENGDNASLVITEVGAPVTGTFTWAPAPDFRTGTLTFTFDDPLIPAKILNLSNFNGTVTGITSFTVAIDSVSFNGTVLGSGSALLPRVTIAAPGGGGGNGGGGNITNGTTYNGTLGAASQISATGPNSGSLNPTTLATGATSFRVATDRSQVRFNNITAGVAIGTQTPGLGGTGTYTLSTNLGSISTFSIIFDNSGVPVTAFYDVVATSQDFQSTRTLRQEITGITVAP